MTIILGIDPGSIVTGFGVIKTDGKKNIHLASGTIKLSFQDLTGKMRQICLGLQQIIEQYHPQEVAIERVFMHANVKSALKLGEARGAAMTAAGLAFLPISEYTARQVKQAIVGFGAANKSQMQKMVKTILGLSYLPATDEADALAIAICHAHHQKGVKLLMQNGIKSSLPTSWRKCKLEDLINRQGRNKSQ